jgi:integrase
MAAFVSKSPEESPSLHKPEPEQLRLIDDDSSWRTVDVVELRRERERLRVGTRAPRTVAEYANDWRHFTTWCAGAGKSPLPASAETLELYLTAHADVHKPSTLRRRLAAIAAAHRAQGESSPAGDGAQLILEAIEREKGSRPDQKAALAPEDLRKISRMLEGMKTRQAARDRAVMVLGFATGLRREELAALKVGDVEFLPKGIVVHVRKSKTDQKRNGREIGVFRGEHPATCPVRTLRAWLKVRGGGDGPLFVRTDHGAGSELEGITGESVNDIVKRSVELIGLDPDVYGGHSLRAGMITAAAAHGVSDTAIMARSGHKSVQTLKRYIRHADLFAFNPLAKAL